MIFLFVFWEGREEEEKEESSDLITRHASVHQEATTNTIRAFSLTTIVHTHTQTDTHTDTHTHTHARTHTHTHTCTHAHTHAHRPQSIVCGLVLLLVCGGKSFQRRVKITQLHEERLKC